MNSIIALGIIHLTRVIIIGMRMMISSNYLSRQEVLFSKWDFQEDIGIGKCIIRCIQISPIVLMLRLGQLEQPLYIISSL